MRLPCRLQGRSAVGVLLLTLSLFAAARPLAGSPPPLIVLITSEQLRSDYLQLYENSFSAGGFGRLLTEGAVYPTARYDHLATLAGPNAAVLATGAYPSLHGIVANRWHERAYSKVVSALESGPSQGSLAVSPLRLIGSTFADELRWATDGRSRILAVSGSAEGAVFLAGRRPTGCYWMGTSDVFQTSRYYRQALPGWVEEFNALHGAVRARGRKWFALGQHTDSVPLRVINARSESDLTALYRASPFDAQDTFALALRSVVAEELGQGDYPDLLVVNVSAPARLAAETGSRSPLMRDMILRLDRLLDAFLNDLDRILGLENVGIVLTGLHGAAPLPETIRNEGLPAGRIRGEDVVHTIDEALRENFGPEVYVEKFIYPYVYLSAAARTAVPERRATIVRTAGEAARTLTGIAGFYSPETGPATAPGADKIQRSWYPDRVGDLALVYEPFFTEDFGNGRGTAPGSYYRYDTDVPLIFYGRGFRAGRFQGPADASDIAPTLSAWLGIAPPSSATGRVLAEALLPKPTTDFVDPDFVGPPPNSP